VFDGLMFVFAVFSDGFVVQEGVADVVEERAGVAVRGEDADVLSGDVAQLSGAVAGDGGNGKGDLDEVAEDEGDCFSALLQDDGFGFERVVDAGAEAFVKIAGHAIADWGRDVGFGHADLKWGGVFYFGGLGDEREDEREAEETESFHLSFFTMREWCVCVQGKLRKGFGHGWNTD
ncbi:MAG: hypothetical protein JWO95_475, partial [Verrucomicrobiales bacterium]|nr:hypothetical protein [Verrucomicrobiales bacterium]